MRTRCLLKDFCSKGITLLEFSELEQLITLHAPPMASLLLFLKQEINTSLPTILCPQKWSKFIGALSCSSAVCALVHPSAKLFALLEKIATEDVTMNPTDMQLLQQEIPVLFEVLSSTAHLPRKALVPLCNSIIEKAKAPFTSESDEVEAEPENKSVLEELAYFPSLPKVRARGMFESDQHNQKVIKCTKQSSGHPSLLPGIFTLFCPHGKADQ